MGQLENLKDMILWLCQRSMREDKGPKHMLNLQNIEPNYVTKYRIYRMIDVSYHINKTKHSHFFLVIQKAYANNSSLISSPLLSLNPKNFASTSTHVISLSLYHSDSIDITVLSYSTISISKSPNWYNQETSVICIKSYIYLKEYMVFYSLSIINL